MPDWDAPSRNPGDMYGIYHVGISSKSETLCFSLESDQSHGIARWSTAIDIYWHLSCKDPSACVEYLKK